MLDGALLKICIHPNNTFLLIHHHFGNLFQISLFLQVLFQFLPAGGGVSEADFVDGLDV